LGETGWEALSFFVLRGMKGGETTHDKGCGRTARARGEDACPEARVPPLGLRALCGAT
jgi:hypothetical protein